MKQPTLISATLRVVSGLGFYSAILCIPAGTISYIPGWIFIGTLATSFAVIMPFLYFRHPDAFQRRMRQQEKEKEQKLVIALLAISGIGGFILSGLDYRWGWSQMPLFVVVLANVFIALCMAGITWVTVINEFAGKTVEVDDSQTVVSTGPYAVVCHPMYSFYIPLMLAIPIALGSYWAFPLFAIVVPIALQMRMVNEEKVLLEELEGYEEYRSKVRWRVLPYLW